MAVEKFAVSFPPGLAAEVRALADESAQSVSGWLADAAQRKMRAQVARRLLDDFEAEHGRITEEELGEVRRQWPA
ncbi:MAG: hypothetical protein M5T61_04110 [Acidimicrobiia bacterium]|nr:hypothetical protein [Acidimicrobiia bacterium]